MVRIHIHSSLNDKALPSSLTLLSLHRSLSLPGLGADRLSDSERQMRDENGFKMHCQSEGHTRKALVAGDNFKDVQEDFSQAFLRDFIELLKTGHREKAVHVNKFYQEYIARKDSVHMSATKWNSLTEFAKYLGRESICRVEEKDDGFYIAWIDDSPEALKRREALRRKELQDKGDEEREQMMLNEQIRRAQKGTALRNESRDQEDAESKELVRQEGEKVKLSFGSKPTPKTTEPAASNRGSDAVKGGSTPAESTLFGFAKEGESDDDEAKEEEQKPASAPPLSLKFGAKPQTKNVFKNAFGGGPKKVMKEQPKKISEAERIMKEEMERKRAREARGFKGPPNKKQRF